MSETTTTVETPKAAPKTTTPKAKAVKAVAKTNPTKVSLDGPTPGDQKKALVKLLRKVGATKAGSAADLGALATKLGVDRKQVYGMVSGLSGKAGSSPTCLLATGHVKIADLEDGLAVYLTNKGVKTEFDDRPFVRA